MNTLINTIGLALLLFVTLCIGLYASKGIRNITEYALANKHLDTGVLVATLLATLVSADNTGLSISFKRGIIGMAYPITFCTSALLLGYFVFPYLLAFKNVHTIAEIMHRLYGPFGRYVTLSASLFFSMLVVVGQLVYIGKMGVFFNLSSTQIIWLVGGTITLYTCLGGIRSIAKTDVIHMYIVFAGLLVTLMLAIKPIGGLNEIMEGLDDYPDHFLFFKNRFFSSLPIVTFFWSGFPILLISPPIIQRVLMTKRHKQVKHMFLSFSACYLIICTIVLCIGLSFLVIKDHLIENGLQNGQIVSGSVSVRLIAYLSHTPLAQAALILVFMALIISTVDSFLNSSTILVINDLIAPNYAVPKRYESFVFIATTFLLGAGSVLTALFVETPGEIVKGISHLFLSVVSVPFILGVIGLKPSKKSFYAGTISFVLSFPVIHFLLKIRPYLSDWRASEGGAYLLLKPIRIFLEVLSTGVLYFLQGILSVPSKESVLDSTRFKLMRAYWFLAIPISIVVFLIVNYRAHGGWIWEHTEEGKLVHYKTYHIKNYVRWLIDPIDWCNQKAAKYIGHPFEVSFWGVLYTLFPYLSNHHINYTALLALRMVSLLICGLIMTKKYWRPPLKIYQHTAYYLLIFWVYAFVPVQTFFLDSSGAYALIYLMVSLFALGVITDSHTFMLFNALAWLMGGVSHRLADGVWAIDLGGNVSWQLVVVSVLPFFFISLVGWKRSQHMKKLQIENKALKFQQELFIKGYEHVTQQIYEALHKNSFIQKKVNEVTQQLLKKGVNTKEIQAIQSSMNHFYKIGHYAKFFLRVRSLKKRMDDLLMLIRTHMILDKQDKEDLFIYNRSQAQSVICDPYYIAQLVGQAVNYITKQQPLADTALYIDDAYLDHQVPAKYGKEPVPALRLTITTEEQAPPSRVKTYQPYAPAHDFIKKWDLHIVENQRITHAHYGAFEIKKQGKHITQTYVIPLDLKALRPKIDDFAREDLYNNTPLNRKKDIYFMGLVKQKKMPLKRIELALKVAKEYHEGQKRDSGTPYYEHPVEVAQILLAYTADPDIIVAALLHDTLEDTAYNMDQMTAMFGEHVTQLVSEVTHLYSKAERPKIKLGKTGTIDRLLAEGNRDSLVIKLADRLHNMRTLGAKSLEKRKKTALETKKIFIPIAKKLNMPLVEQELRALVRSYLAAAAAEGV